MSKHSLQVLVKSISLVPEMPRYRLILPLHDGCRVGTTAEFSDQAGNKAEGKLIFTDDRDGFVLDTLPAADLIVEKVRSRG